MINLKEVELENPFGAIIQYVVKDENLAFKGLTNNYRFWVISESKLTEILNTQLIASF